MEKFKVKKESYSFSELNEIRSKSVDDIRKIRDEILSQNITDNNKDSEIKRLETGALLNYLRNF